MTYGAKEEDSESLASLYAASRATGYRNPMDGTGEKPILIQGYENCVLSC